MKPNFALILSSEVIGLLHRTPRGWLPVGEVATDSADLAVQLSWLRATAMELSPQGFSTKLILPNDQILYDEIAAPGPETAQRRRQIRRALEGRTPYPLEDLVFDWWGTGERVRIAVVAKETLEEAEAFAEEHGFQPVSFVAIPPDPAFAGEPFFGQAKAAARIVGAGESVSRDQDPVKILARDPAAEAPVQPPPEQVGEATPEAPTDAAPESAPPVEAIVEAQVAPVEDFVGTPLPESAEEVPSPVESAPEPAADVTAPAADSEAPAEVSAADAAEAEGEPPVPPAEAAAAPDFSALATALSVAKSRASSGFVSQRKTASDETAAAVFSGLLVPEEPPAAVPAPAQAAGPTFASRRRDDLSAIGPRPVPPLTASPPLPGAEPAGMPDVLPEPATAPSSASGTTLPPLPPAKGAAGPKATANLVPLGAAPPRPPSSARPGGTPTAARTGKARSGAGSVSAPESASEAGGRPTPAEAPQSGTGRAATASPGSLGSRPPVGRGKPRYLGLILTGALLLFLFIIAAWSSLYLADGSGAEDTAPALADGGADAVSPPPADGEDLAATEALDPEFEADLAAMGEAPEGAVAATGTGPADAQEDAASAAAIEAAVSEAVEAAPEDVPPAAPDPPPADAAAAASAGGSAIAAPGLAAQDEIMLARVDAAPPALDPLTLPPAAAPDTPPPPQMPPPPFGAVYAFGPDGRLVAPTTGIVTPEGVWLIAARPPLLPPPRPRDLAGPETPAAEAEAGGVALPAETPAAAGVDAVGVAPASGFQPDPAAAALRPRARPPAPPQQAEDDARLQPQSDTRLASLRPAARPAGLVVAAAPAASAAGASLFAASASGANPGAVVFSRRPAPRPADFSRAVEAAVAAAVAPAEPAPDNGSEAANPALSPEEAAEDSGGDEPSAAPRIPTKASVAKEATYANAINLSKINLIGIYGTESSRSALVRLASGRYVKVEVGDRIDGGKVAAITTSELRYQKGGRLITLAMPRS